MSCSTRDTSPRDLCIMTFNVNGQLTYEIWDPIPISLVGKYKLEMYLPSTVCKLENFVLQSVHCTVLHMFTQVLFWAGNQNNHQNFDTSLLPKKL